TNSAGVSESDVATLTVLALPDLPTIDQQPDDKSLLVGETLELNVGIIPTTEKIFFQWYFEGTAIVGANSSNLTIENVSIEHSGSYWVEISNVTGLVRSETADVRVTMDAAPLRPVDYEFAPKILSNPQPRNLAPGDALNLTVVADGLPLPTYLWFHNQAPLDEQQAATLAIDKSVSENAGEYFVVVRNIHGIAVSDPVTVSVKEKTVETSPVDQNSGDVTDLNTGSPADNVEDKQDITKDEGQKPDDQQQADKTATDDAQSSNKTSGSALSPNVLLIWVSLFLALRVCRQLSINFALKSKRFS
ncbi:MAG TPA: hypothetical protein ENK06_13340, partial [Gammaproteobacteria bacterium]|nr:hypothetical protein [Gammaproteobacteria bacterium]